MAMSWTKARGGGDEHLPFQVDRLPARDDGGKQHQRQRGQHAGDFGQGEGVGECVHYEFSNSPAANVAARCSLPGLNT